MYLMLWEKNLQGVAPLQLLGLYQPGRESSGHGFGT
jgi:hypothetical protein